MDAKPVSYLFVPASRPDRVTRALSSAADRVIVDLEDAVPTDAKDEALQYWVDTMERETGAPMLVRIHGADTQLFRRDIRALEQLTPRGRGRLAGVVVAKAQTAESLAAVRAAAGDASELIPLVESARGLSNAGELATAPGVARLALGAADLSLDLDADISSPVIDMAASLLVLASRVAGLPGPIASPPFVLEDAGAIEADARRLRGMGLTAQLCIHPAQLAAVHAGFGPTTEQVEWARRVVTAADGASRLEGQMIDKPLVDRARRILAGSGAGTA